MCEAHHCSDEKQNVKIYWLSSSEIGKKKGEIIIKTFINLT